VIRRRWTWLDVVTLPLMLPLIMGYIVFRVVLTLVWVPIRIAEHHLERVLERLERAERRWLGVPLPDSSVEVEEER